MLQATATGHQVQATQAAPRTGVQGEAAPLSIRNAAAESGARPGPASTQEVHLEEAVQPQTLASLGPGGKRTGGSLQSDASPVTPADSTGTAPAPDTRPPRASSEGAVGVRPLLEQQGLPVPQVPRTMALCLCSPRTLLLSTRCQRCLCGALLVEARAQHSTTTLKAAFQPTGRQRWRNSQVGAAGGSSGLMVTRTSMCHALCSYGGRGGAGQAALGAVHAPAERPPSGNCRGCRRKAREELVPRRLGGGQQAADSSPGGAAPSGPSDVTRDGSCWALRVGEPSSHSSLRTVSIAGAGERACCQHGAARRAAAGDRAREDDGAAGGSGVLGGRDCALAGDHAGGAAPSPRATDGCPGSTRPPAFLVQSTNAQTGALMDEIQGKAAKLTQLLEASSPGKGDAHQTHVCTSHTMQQWCS